MKPTKAHVICCNDSVEHVVLDDEKLAEEIKEQLAEADAKERRNSAGQFHRADPYWHIHTVGVQ